MAKTNQSSSISKNKTKRYAKSRSRHQRNNTKIIVGVAALAAILILVIFLGANNPSGQVGDIDGVQTFSNLAGNHTLEPVQYPQDPPVGGPHNPAWQNCGVYTSPVPNENAVHSLEHGVIWITYQPDLPADELEKLQNLTRQSSYRLLSPYPGLTSPIVVSAWGYQLRLDSAEDERLGQFIQKYEQNPNGPEPGASCAGGVGQPG
jgi:hypothetical protein